VSAAGAAGLAGYAWRIEPHWVKVIPRDLPVAGLPAALAGGRLVQISDLHVGPHVADAYLVEAFGRVAALRPDILVVTGDFLTYRHATGAAQFDQLRGVLAHLPQGRWATLGILGNHDYGRRWAEPEVAANIVREAERVGMRVLRNEVANVRGLDVVGIDDLWARRAAPLAALRSRSSDAALALCHNPDALDAMAWGDFRGWVLAGHTHGGQCKPPFLPPPVLPVRNRRYVAGELALSDGRRLYINPGLGYYLRVRFNARPEITVFTLRAANAG
jgi:predicted MPP superfamily phosphohydrolase